MRHGRLPAAAAVAGLVAMQLAVALSVRVPPAQAADDERHGWWSRSTLASGVGVAPPDVPANGLYVEGSPAGPVAYAALSLELLVQPLRVTLTLRIAGAPLIVGPPSVCALTEDFVPVQGGAWTEGPAYDCTRTLQGTVDATQTTVQFDLTSFAAEGHLEVAVLAADTGDRIAFEAPTTESLDIVTGVPAAPSASATEAPGGGGSQSAPPVLVPPGSSVLPPLAAATLTPSPSAVPAPALAPTTSQGQPTTSASTLLAADQAPHKLAIGLGVALLVLCICYWADGFGAWPVRRGRALSDAAGADADHNTRDRLTALVGLAAEESHD